MFDPKSIIKEDLIEYYINQKLSVYKIGKKLGCNRSTIYKLFEKHNILLRSCNKQISKEILRGYYVEQKLSTVEIAEIFDCDYTTILSYLHKYNIPLRYDRKTKYNQIITKELLQELYCDQNLSLKSCGEKLNCDAMLILFYLRKYNISTRKANNSYLEKAILEDLYINQKLSTPEIGKQLGHTARTIWLNLLKFDIPIRSISESLKGKPISEESKRKNSESNKGKISWNTGLTKETDERLMKMSNNFLGKFIGEKNPFFGKLQTEEAKYKISKSRRGKLVGDSNPAKRPEVKKKISDSLKKSKIFKLSVGFYGFSKDIIEEYYINQKLSLTKCAEKLSCSPLTVQNYLKRFNIPQRSSKEAQTGRKHLEETKQKMSIKQTKLWQDPEYMEKQRIAQNIFPNKPESFLLTLLNELYPGQWKYTGDFSFTINGKNPDFANFQNKQIIEHFGTYWHKDDDPIKRMEIFAKEGWDTLVIWEDETKNNLDELIYKIKSFVEITV